MRARAAPGVCATEHVLVDGRGAGRSIDAGGLGGGEQLRAGPRAQGALLAPAAVPVSYPGLGLGGAPHLLDEAGGEAVHALAGGRAHGVGR